MAKKLTEKDDKREITDLPSATNLRETVWHNTPNLRMAHAETKSTLETINDNLITQGLVYNTAVSMESLRRLATPLSQINTSGMKFYGGSSSDKEMELIQNIAELKKEKNELAKQLTQETDDRKKLVEDYNKINFQLQSQETRSHIVSRISKPARDILLETNKFDEYFTHGRPCKAVVISIDIRRSTELMLKARSPELYSSFITLLTGYLSDCIISNFGIFDKFTGDGILAFFPDFYSEEDAIIRALSAAQQCHEIFNEHYNNSRSIFNVFIKDIGLGIGVDYGDVTLVNTNNELTVVGIPVVYACRMSGANAGETLLNQSAKEEIELHCKSQMKVEETSIFIKNEGNALAYKVELNQDVYDNLKNPQWLEMEESKKENTVDNPIP